MLNKIEKLTDFLDRKFYILLLFLAALYVFGIDSKIVSISTFTFLFIWLGGNMVQCYIKYEFSKFLGYFILALFTVVLLAYSKYPYPCRW